MAELLKVPAFFAIVICAIYLWRERHIANDRRR